MNIGGGNHNNTLVCITVQEGMCFQSHSEYLTKTALNPQVSFPVSSPSSLSAVSTEKGLK